MSSNELEGQLVRTHDDTRRFKILRLSTAERVNGLPYDFVVNLGNDFRMDTAIEVHLVSASIPNVANNVSAVIGNNIFRIQYSATGTVQVVVPDGFYNINQLTSYLQNQINIATPGTTLTITQDPITGQLTFTVVGLETFQFLAAEPGLPFDIGIYSPLSPTLGGNLNSLAGRVTYTLDGIPSLYGSTMFFIHSQELAPELTYLQSDGSDVNSVNGMFTIPVNVPFGAIQTYAANDQDRVVFGRIGRSARNFHLTIRTNGGRLYTELTDNQEAIFIMRLLWSSSMN